MTDKTFIFFDVKRWEPQFKLVGDLEQALDIINSSGGQLYFRELKDKKLIVVMGLRAGEEGPEKLSAADIKQLQIEGKMKAEKYYLEVDPQHLLKADPQPRYLQIPFGNGFMRIPSNDILIVKTMFIELLKIDGVKEIMEKYGVTFHGS